MCFNKILPKLWSTHFNTNNVYTTRKRTIWRPSPVMDFHRLSGQSCSAEG